MQASLLTELLTNLLEIPITEWQDEGNSCDRFEQLHCFSPQIQVQLTADALELFCRSIKEHCLYEIQDRLGLRVILFKGDRRTILAGPYVTEEWGDERGRETLIRNELPANKLIPYKLYYCSYRVAATADVLHCIRGVAGTLSEDKTPYRHQVIAGLHKETAFVVPEEEGRDFAQVIRRYEAENELIRMVQKGDADGVRRARQRAAAASADSALHYITSSDWMTSISITRTLLRKAAEGAGVHPAVVDAISFEYEQKANHCRNISQSSLLSEEMIEAFCEAVRVVKKENYSPIIRRTVDYIQMHLSSSLSLKKIAEAAGVGATRLERMFKAETGATISGYIAQQRCGQAAELLSSTSLTVQEISSYVGYLDNNYFVKVFKTQYYMTPTEYRRRHKNFSGFQK